MTVKYFEIFPKHNGYGFISESFTLNLHIFVALTNENADLNKVFFLVLNN